MLKKYFWSIFIVALFLVTLASLPRVDYAEPNVFFYFQRLPLTYHICVVASIFIALLSKQRLTQILSVCILGLLIMWTPFVVLVQPWHLDSYPFLAQGVYVAKNGHIRHFGYLSETPGLGLIFGSYLLMTGINPVALLKIYPVFFVIILIALICVITNMLKIGRNASIVATLLLVAIFWPNYQHVTRQGLGLIPYLMSLFLLFYLIFHRADRRIFVLLCLQIPFLVLSHPATPLIFVYNLVAIVGLGWVSGKVGSKDLKLITHVAIVSIILMLLWNMIGTEPDIMYAIKSMSTRAFGSLKENPAEASGAARIFVGYTKIYSLTLNIRFSLTFLVYLASFLVPLLSLILRKHLKDWKPLVILVGWAWSNLSITVPLLYAGLPYFARPALFSFISWAPLGALAYNMINNRSKGLMTPKTKNRIPSIIKNMVKPMFLLAFVIGPALIVPIVKYAPLPYLYPTSVELANKHFWDLHWSGGNILYLEHHHPIFYSYILNVTDEPRPTGGKWVGLNDVYRSGEGLISDTIHETSIWITYRLCTRDGFNSYNPSMFEFVENITKTLPESTHNKVYDAGWPESILIPIKG